MDLALQIQKDKTFPWPGCANVAFPLVTIAALQFHSRAYPTILNGSEIVRYRVNGDDPQGIERRRGELIGKHMSYQLLEEDQSWEEQHDRLLINVPIVGSAFKKTFHSGIKGHNRSDLVLAQDLVLDYYAKSVEECERKTQIIPMYRNEIHEGIMTGIYRDVRESEWYQNHAQPMTDENVLKQDNRQGKTVPQNDDTTPYTMLEQHLLLDLDHDGYKEPYIVFIRRDTQKIYRIVARYFEKSIERRDGRIVRINPEQYFTKYGFIPSPDGGFYDLGFGTLLGPLNDSINTIVNQLIDAGTMSVTGGGFLGRGVKIKGGDYTFKPHEWKRVDSTGDDLRANIFPLPVREPNAVSFQLLQLLINYGERIAGATDMMVGVTPGQNTPAETSRNALNQGEKVFNGIFKRTWRAMKEEFQKLYRLNQLYLPSEPVEFEYNNELSFVLPDDYSMDMKLVKPAADPNVVSDSQRQMQAQAVLQLASTTPGFNMYEVQKRYLDALKVYAIDQVLPDPKGPNAIKPGPSEKMQIEQMKNQERQINHQLKFKLGIAKLMSEAELMQAKVTELQAKAVLELEQADGVKNGHAIAMLEAEIGAKRAHMDGILKSIELMRSLEQETADTTKEIGNDTTGVQRMEGQPNN